MKKIIKNVLLSLILATTTVGCAGTKTTESTGEYFDDSMITTKIKSAILANSRLRSLDISVVTFKGVVQLSGFVDSKSVAEVAVDVARKVHGVKAVNNSLVVKQ